MRKQSRHSDVYRTDAGEEKEEEEEEETGRRTGARRNRRCGAGRRSRWRGFTEEEPSGWRSPPLPRLSAQTQTAPEGKKGGKQQGKGNSATSSQND